MEPTIVNKPKTDNIVMKIKLGLILIFVFSLLVSLCVFAFAVMGAANNAKNSNTTTTSSQSSTTTTPEEATTTSETTTSSEEVSTLPAGWSYQVETNCGVSLAVPPKVAPYYTLNPTTGVSVFWRVFTEGSYTDSILGTVPMSGITYQGFQESTGTVVGGDVIKGVSLVCKDDTGLDLQDLRTAYLSSYSANFSNSGRYGKCIAKTEDLVKWGENVARVWLECDAEADPVMDSYLVVKGDRAYKILFNFDTYQNEEVTQLRATAEQILDGLKLN